MFQLLRDVLVPFEVITPAKFSALRAEGCSIVLGAFNVVDYKPWNGLSVSLFEASALRAAVSNIFRITTERIW